MLDLGGANRFKGCHQGPLSSLSFSGSALHPIPATLAITFPFSTAAQTSLVLIKSCAHAKPITWARKIPSLWLARFGLQPHLGTQTGSASQRMKRAGPWGKSSDLQEENGPWADTAMDAHYPQPWRLIRCLVSRLAVFTCSCPRLENPWDKGLYGCYHYPLENPGLSSEFSTCSVSASSPKFIS